VGSLIKRKKKLFKKKKRMKWKKGKVTEIEEAVLSLISSKITELS